MKILVTGGKGFIGAPIIRRLVERGHQVVCVDLKTSPGRLGSLAERVVMVANDSSRLEDILAIIKENRVERIAHMVFFQAQERGVAGRSDQPEELYRQMMVMNTSAFHIFEAARLSGIKRVIYPSSIAYHGLQPFVDGKPILVDEESPSLSTELYGIGKHLCEKLAGQYNKWFGSEYITVRIPGVYGPGVKIGARGVNLICTVGGVGQPVPLPYAADQKACLAHVDDVAEICVRLLLMEKVENETYQVGGHITDFEMMAKIGREFIPDMQVSFADRKMQHAAYVIDDSRMRRDVGVEHRSLRAGFLELINLSRKEAGLPEIKAD